MAWQQDVRDWHAKRIERLKREGGWLSLAGLFWLKEGVNRVGSDDALDVVLPKSVPKTVGELTRAGENVTFTPAAGAGVTLAAASGGTGASAAATAVTAATPLRNDHHPDGPQKLTVGTVTFHVIKRGDRIGVRVTDTEAPTRKNFHGIDTWPIDAAWRIEATWVPFDPPRSIEIPTVIPGLLETYPVPGEAVFTLGGKERRLQPVLEEPGATELFFIFGDETNGPESYGAGRFLYTPLPKDGKVILDFNKSYNPPCAFTPYATCPLPPDENRLATRVTAGEKKYGDH